MRLSGSSLARSRSIGSRTAATATAWTAAWSRAAQDAVGRQLDLEPLGADARQRLAAQRGVEDVRGDLRVEGDRGQIARVREHVARRVRIATRQLPDEQLLDLVADQRPAGLQDQVGEVAARCRPRQ